MLHSFALLEAFAQGIKTPGREWNPFRHPAHPHSCGSHTPEFGSDKHKTVSIYNRLIFWSLQCALKFSIFPLLLIHLIDEL